MPASGADPVASALRGSFSNGTKLGNLDNGVESSAKRVLYARIEFEPTTNYQSTVLSSLKSKYIVINTSATANKLTNGTNGVNKKIESVPAPKVTLFPLEDVQIGFRSGVPVGSGMTNLGNTCYLNSTLQALFHVPAFINWLLGDPHHAKCEQFADVQLHPDDITCAVIKTLKCAQQKTGSSMKPLCIYSKLKAICRHLSQGSQEDAHEFMRYLLESLEKSFLSKVQGHNLDSWSKETTPVNQIFGGYIRNEVACLTCRAVSTTFQHFQDLPLDIRRASTLDDALAAYFERERLPDGDDAYKCEKCNRKVAATKKFSIERPPNVLCVQLKRFSLMNGKLTKQVQLPQHLDLTRFVSAALSPRSPVKYKLVSMVTHMGQSANCGHYTAIAQAANGHYYEFDDASVRQIPLSTVLNMNTYLVLYELEKPFSAFAARSVETASASDTQNKSASLPNRPSNSFTGRAPTPARPIVPNTSRMAGATTSSPVKTVAATTNSGKPASPTKTFAQPTPVAPSNSTSLVPYESDVDSDVENKDSDCTPPGWKVTSAKSRLPVASSNCTSSWKITDVQPSSRNNGTAPHPSSEADCRPPSDADAPPRANTADASDAQRSADRASERKVNGDESRNGTKFGDQRGDVVNELQTNSHRGYGNTNVRSWNGDRSTMSRQVQDERIESRKRSADDLYNEEFDRGKVKRKRGLDRRRKGHNWGQVNQFQQRNNMHNEWRHNRYDKQQQKHHRYPYAWEGFRRNNYNQQYRYFGRY